MQRAGKYWGFPGGGSGTEPVNARDLRDTGSIPGSERSPGEGNGYALQYSGLENSMDCIVFRVAKSQTQLSDFNFHELVKIFKNFFFTFQLHVVLKY